MSESVYENVVKEVDNLLNKKIEKKYQKVISDIDKIISTYEINNYKNQEIHHKNQLIKNYVSADHYDQNQFEMLHFVIFLDLV